MSRPKYDDPCPCGSGLRYRQCHLKIDREAHEGGAQQQPSAPPPARVPAPPRPVWLRVLPLIVGVVGGIATLVVSQQAGSNAGLPMLLATGMAIVAIYILGNPPPPREDAGNPADIDFGRRDSRGD